MPRDDDTGLQARAATAVRRSSALGTIATRHARIAIDGPTGCSRCCRMTTTSDCDRICRRSSWTTGRASMKRRVRSSMCISPSTGVASLVITTADGDSAEVGTIGSEGIVGLPICLGDRDAPSAVYVQVPGTALSMDARLFRGELDRSPTLNLVMLRYAHAFFNQVAQSAACAPPAPGGTALLPLAADDARPDAVGRFPAHPGIPRNDAGRAANHRSPT